MPYVVDVARKFEQVLEEIRAWPLEEQEKLAVSIVSSLEEPGDDLGDDWKDDVSSRLEQIERGEVELLDGEELLRELRARRTAPR